MKMNSDYRFISLQVKRISIRKVLHITVFETEAQGNSEMVHLLLLLKMIKNTCCILVIVALKVLTGNLDKDNE